MKAMLSSMHPLRRMFKANTLRLIVKNELRDSNFVSCSENNKVKNFLCLWREEKHTAALNSRMHQIYYLNFFSYLVSSWLKLLKKPQQYIYTKQQQKKHTEKQKMCFLIRKTSFPHGWVDLMMSNHFSKLPCSWSSSLWIFHSHPFYAVLI